MAAHRHVAFVALVVAGAALVSCSTHVLVGKDDHPDASTLSPPGPHVDAALPSDSLDAGEVRCGQTICGAVDLGRGLGRGEGCCYAFTHCGALFSSVCVELNAEGASDPSCPVAGGYPGCCKPDGTCGIEAVGTRLGCVNPFVGFPTSVLGRCVYRDQ